MSLRLVQNMNGMNIASHDYLPLAITTVKVTWSPKAINLAIHASFVYAQWTSLIQARACILRFPRVELFFSGRGGGGVLAVSQTIYTKYQTAYLWISLYNFALHCVVLKCIGTTCITLHCIAYQSICNGICIWSCFASYRIALHIGADRCNFPGVEAIPFCGRFEGWPPQYENFATKDFWF